MDYTMTGISADAFQSCVVQIFIITSLVQMIKPIMAYYNIPSIWATPVGIVVGIGTQMIMVVLSGNCSPESVLAGLQYGTLFGLSSNGTFDTLQFFHRVGDTSDDANGDAPKKEESTKEIEKEQKEFENWAHH